MLPEGPAAPFPSDQEVRRSLERQQRDALLVITYRLSTYYALAIVTLALAVDGRLGGHSERGLLISTAPSSPPPASRRGTRPPTSP